MWVVVVVVGTIPPNQPTPTMCVSVCLSWSGFDRFGSGGHWCILPVPLTSENVNNKQLSINFWGSPKAKTHMVRV